MNSKELTEEEVSQLARGGECYIHTHPKEVLTFNDRLELMNAAPIITVTSDFSPTEGTEIIFADSSSGNISITLPVANRGREFQVVKVSPANTVFIIPSGTDTILGSPTGVSFSGYWTSLHLKGVFGTGYIPL